MSKSKRNYREPAGIFDSYGADALRWYFFANQAPWNSIIYSEKAIKESIPEFLLRLWNVYSFCVTYANVYGWKPTDEGPALAEFGDVDRSGHDLAVGVEGDDRSAHLEGAAHATPRDLAGFNVADQIGEDARWLEGRTEQR